MELQLAHPEKQTQESDDLSSMEAPRRFGLALLVVVFGVFGQWAAIAPLDGAAFALGTVTVKSYKKVLQHLEGGIVADILVKTATYGIRRAIADTGRPRRNWLEIVNSNSSR